MSDKKPYRTWAYWRDDKGYVNAVMDYFPEEYQDNPDVQQAVAMIQNGKRALDMIFGELSEAEWDAEEE